MNIYKPIDIYSYLVGGESTSGNGALPSPRPVPRPQLYKAVFPRGFPPLAFHLSLLFTPWRLRIGIRAFGS